MRTQCAVACSVNCVNCVRPLARVGAVTRRMQQHCDYTTQHAVTLHRNEHQSDNDCNRQTPRKIQWCCGLLEGIFMNIKKLVECPVVASTPAHCITSERWTMHTAERFNAKGGQGAPSQGFNANVGQGAPLQGAASITPHVCMCS